MCACCFACPLPLPADPPTVPFFLCMQILLPARSATAAAAAVLRSACSLSLLEHSGGGTLHAHQPCLRACPWPVCGAAGWLEEKVGMEVCWLILFPCSHPDHPAPTPSAVIHDWQDEPATAILKTIRRAARPTSRLLIAGERSRGFEPAQQNLPRLPLFLHPVILQLSLPTLMPQPNRPLLPACSCCTCTHVRRCRPRHAGAAASGAGPGCARPAGETSRRLGHCSSLLPHVVSACSELRSAAARAGAVPSMHPLRQLLLHCFSFNPRRPTIRFIAAPAAQMMAFPGGKDRTVAEWRALLGAAGWRLERIVPLRGMDSVVVGAPA